MNSRRTVCGAAPTAVVLALTAGATAAAADPSPLPTRAQAAITADQRINVGPEAQSVGVAWTFWDGGAQVPIPTDETLVIDARDLTGTANVTVHDPRCEADGQVITCVNKEPAQSRSVEFTLRGVAGATLGDSGTITYTVTAGRATGTTATAKVVVGVPKLVVGKVPDVTHAAVGSRIDIPLRLRNTGPLATDRRIMLRWESVGGLVFDRKFSNCTYGSGGEPAEPGSRVSVTCVFSAPVAAGATVELSSPLTATVGKRVLTGVVDYSAGLLKPGVRPGEGRQGTGPALGLVPVSGAGGGFEQEGEGRFTVAADNSADLAATATVRPGRGSRGWTLDINAVNHGPASAHGVDDKAVALVDVVLPKGTVATGTAYIEGEDSPYGRCLLRVSSDETAPFEAGHRHYVCPVPFGVAAGQSQLFKLWVKPSEDYDGGKGTATVRPGPAGFPLNDPDASNDSTTFAFRTATATAPSATGPAAPVALITTVGVGALLLGAVVLVGRRRRGSR